MPTESPSPPVAVARSPLDVLRVAAARVTARLDEVYPPLAPGGTPRAEGYLGTLRSKLEQILAGEDPKPIREWLATSPMFPPLMDALGRELIDIGSSEPDAAIPTMAALQAWSAARGATAILSPSATERADDLRGRMRGPDAFELLVEVAHDFRSPLTSILFLAEALRDGNSGQVTDAQRSQLGLIYSAALGLASIASDVMDLARREQDLIGGEPEPFALIEVFQRVERTVRPLVEEKRLQLRVVVPERWHAEGHPHALSRVLLNLTTNALKFTDEGSVELGVRPLPHARMEFYVQDTGRGITPEQQRSLFHPFRPRSGAGQAGSYFSSSGIGLSIARRLLKAMGAELTLDSSDERGTRFSFVLPSAVQR
jgi:signal transduction histidine kinase